MNSKRAAQKKDVQALSESAVKYSERAEKERNLSHNIAYANSVVFYYSILSWYC